MDDYSLHREVWTIQKLEGKGIVASPTEPGAL
jgi:hypothetical protein